MGDKKGEHYWSRAVSDVTAFESDLLAHVQMSKDAYAGYIEEMRSYRDKFVAHLDAGNTMQIPMLDTAHASVSFYHSHLVTHKVQTGELSGIGVDIPSKFRLGYEQCVEEARAALRNVKDHTTFATAPSRRI